MCLRNLWVKPSGFRDYKTYDDPESGSHSDVRNLHGVETTAHIPRRSR